MKEFVTTFDQGFSVGLPYSSAMGTNTEFLTRALNVLPTKEGLEIRPFIINSYPDFAVRWPFPALYMLTKHNLVFNYAGLFSDMSGELTQIASVEYLTLPHVADFQDLVMYATEETVGAVVNGVYTREPWKGVRCATCTNFKGQLIVGNCTLPNGPSLEEDGTIANNTKVGGPNYVAWSKIGQVDFTFTLSNEVGYAEMPWQGEVLCVLPLGDTVMVYGDNGITKLEPVLEPSVTFKLEDFGDVGILNRNCVSGDDNQHVFLGKDFNLYSVSPRRALSDAGYAPNKLGYKEYLKELTDPIVTYDSHNRVWWICDYQKSFLYNGVGLSQASESPTHVSNLDGSVFGFTTPNASDEIHVETSPINLNSSAIKTLNCVEAAISAEGASIGEVEGGVDYKFASNSGYRMQRWINLSPEGAFFPCISGVTLKIRYRAPFNSDFKLNKLWLHWKATDKRFSRGIINAGSPEE